MTRRTVLAGVGALVVAGVAAGLSQATAPGSNGRIVFTRYELHDTPLTSHIVVANSDGSGQRTITHASRKYEDDQPDWSPNGSRVLFERCINDQCHLWTMRPDGSQQRRLSPRCPGNPSPPRCPDDTYPVYSPDGKHIAFTRYRSGPEVVMVADANARHPRAIGRGVMPGWSPDGKQLVFVSKPRAYPAVFVANADGSGLRRITPWKLRAGDHPDWSPDGTRILFGAWGPGPGNLFTIRLDGTGLQQLTHNSGQTGVSTGSWSPDGKSIVFGTAVGAVNGPGGTLNDLFVMNADGTHRRPITRTRNYDGSPDWGPRR
jgi:Tol biopolymer transport system component